MSGWQKVIVPLLILAPFVIAEKCSYKEESACLDDCSNTENCVPTAGACWTCAVETCTEEGQFASGNKCKESCKGKCKNTGDCFICEKNDSQPEKTTEKPTTTTETPSCEFEDFHVSESACQANCNATCVLEHDCWYCGRCESDNMFYTKAECSVRCDKCSKVYNQETDAHCFTCSLARCDAKMRTKEACEYFGECRFGCEPSKGCWKCAEATWTVGAMVGALAVITVTLIGIITVTVVSVIRSKRPDFAELNENSTID